MVEKCVRRLEEALDAGRRLIWKKICLMKLESKDYEAKELNMGIA